MIWLSLCLILADDRTASLKSMLMLFQESTAASVDPQETTQPPSDVSSDPLAATSITWEITTASTTPQLQLYTADGWVCGPCEAQKRTLKDKELPFTYETVGVRYSTDSPTGQVPVWKAADGSVLSGNQSIDTLTKFATEHSQTTESSATATINGIYNADLIGQLIATHLSDEQPVGGLFDIDVKAPQNILDIARQLLIQQEWNTSHLTVS